MPSNKKKNKKKEVKTSNTTTTSNATTTREDDDKDDLQKALKWSKSSKVHNPASLAKKFPKTAAKLRDGTYDPDELAESLAHAQFFSGSQSGLKPRDNPSMETDPIDAVYVLLSSSTGLSFDEAYEFYQQLWDENIIQQEAILSQQSSTWGSLTAIGEKTMVGLYQAFQVLGRKWETRILQNTRRDHTKFAFYKFYNVNIDKFSMELFNSIKNNFDLQDPGVIQNINNMRKAEETYQTVKTAAKGIVNKVDQQKHTCWECNRSSLELGISMSCCTRCHMATYCSKECQTAAWRSGHKKGCSELGKQYAMTIENRKRVKQAIADSQIVTEPVTGKDGKKRICYMKPVPIYDFTLAGMLAVYNTKLPIPGIKGPSMDIFYRNMAILACGGTHALFAKESMKNTYDFIECKTFDEEKVLHNMKPVVEDEIVTMNMMFGCLAWDLDEVTDTEDIAKFVDWSYSQTPGGKLISVRRMIEIYGLQSNVKEIEKCGVQQKYDADSKTYEILKHLYHKL